MVEQALGNVQHDDVAALGLFGEGGNEFLAGATVRGGGLVAEASEWLARRSKREVVSF